jgi:Domain of unknown function (DUF5655)/Domain of unknown function (DUF4287)
MADPQTAIATQLRNIESKTGKTFAQLCKLIDASGLTKVGEQRAMLMDKLRLGYGDANMLALRAKEAAMPTAGDGDPLDALYAGPRAPLRKLHERLHAEISKLGTFETAPKKRYVSLRRKKQFAMLGPATKDTVELGLNAKALPASARLKALPPGGMCQYTVRLSKATDIDAELMKWMRAAYDAAA